MTAASYDLETPRREGKLLSLPVAGTVKIYANTLVAMDSTGYARPARASTTDKIIGRATSYVDNTNGTDGLDQYGNALRIELETGIFRFANGDSITMAANRGDVAYAVDDATVAKGSNSNARVVAGRIVDVDSLGVWVAVGDAASVEGDAYSGTFAPTFTAGTNTTGAGTPVGYFTRVGKIVSFTISVPDVVCTAGAPTASTFDVSLPIASNIAAVGDLVATVTGQNLASGIAIGDVTDNRIDVAFSCTFAASNDVVISGHYQIL